MAKRGGWIGVGVVLGACAFLAALFVLVSMIYHVTEYWPLVLLAIGVICVGGYWVGSVSEDGTRVFEDEVENGRRDR